MLALVSLLLTLLRRDFLLELAAELDDREICDLPDATARFSRSSSYGRTMNCTGDKAPLSIRSSR